MVGSGVVGLMVVRSYVGDRGGIESAGVASGRAGPCHGVLVSLCIFFSPRADRVDVEQNTGLTGRVPACRPWQSLLVS